MKTKNAETPAKKTTWLRGKLLEALEQSSTDAELVDLLITNGALTKAVHVGTYDTEEVAQALGIAVQSVRTLTTKKKTIFPRPTITERRYARKEVETYAHTRQKRPSHTAESEESSE